MRPQSIFLTGATGAVGGDLLRTLATRNDVRINVLVRRTDRNPCDRVKAVLGDLDVTATINVVEGDISCGSTLGVDGDVFAKLRRETTHIIHAAGTTSFTLPLAAARAANVDGARNVLDFAGSCASLESGAFLSTVYVSGKRRGIFAEWEYGDRGEGFVNSYEQSKAEMESLVRDAMEELPLSLVRLSTVVGDSATGRVSGFNTIHHAIRLLYNGLAPMIPGDPAEPVDIVSSDFVSAAVLHLVENAKHGVFHLAAGRDSSSSLDDLIGETVSALTKFRPAWRKRAVERPLIVDLDTYELFVRSVEETGNEVLKGATRSIRTFAYQLAHPKVFVTNRAAAILDGSGIAPQPSSDFYPRVVKYCLDSNWGSAPVLTANELEQRLLRFTREQLATPEFREAITVDTLLFEDRVIDSLKVLELIAFLQSALGRKIPDAQIVLANFRSISTIARVFTDGEPAVMSRKRHRASRSALVRAKGEHDGNGRASRQSGVAELFARRELELTPDGGLIVRGPAASLCEYFDTVVRGWAFELGAIEEAFPAEIPLATLGRAGFTTAFPEKLVWTGDAVDKSARPPAVCYHHYPSVSDSTLDGGVSIVTSLGRCFRNEYDASSYHPAERLAAFTMREIIAVGDAALIEGLRRDLMDRVSSWMKELSLDGHVEVASDPFFTSEARGRMLMQQMLPLKYELQLRVDPDGRSVAAASFNNHQQHFGRAFSILLPSGEHAHSGCVAFGWERWMIAFVNQHGPDEENWPGIVRSTNVAASV